MPVCQILNFENKFFSVGALAVPTGTFFAERLSVFSFCEICFLARRSHGKPDNSTLLNSLFVFDDEMFTL